MSEAETRTRKPSSFMVLKAVGSVAVDANDHPPTIGDYDQIGDVIEGSISDVRKAMSEANLKAGVYQVVSLRDSFTVEQPTKPVITWSK